MKPQIILGIMLAITLTGLTACTTAREAKPPDIAYGQEMCDQCGMIISEARFAAALLLENGEYRKFDDIGEMTAYVNENPEHQIEAWFVHDYASEVWLRGEQAYYVSSETVQTPMGTGIVAFREKITAGTFAKENNGKVMSFEEVLSIQTTMGGHN